MTGLRVKFATALCMAIVSAVDIMCSTYVSAEPFLSRFEYSEVAMGVRARIVVYVSDEKQAERASSAAFRRIAHLDEVMSDYRPSSELMRLCEQAGKAPMHVSKELLFVLRKSQELARRSQGAFDITVGPIVKLWREARKCGSIPPADKLNQARKLIGWQNVILDDERSTVQLKYQGMLLDLGGIAKGYACDEALRMLRKSGVASALVEMGGDIAVSAPPPGKNGWDISIPNAAESGQRNLVLANSAVSSSGDAEQYVEIGGVRYSHIVDPRTGLGLTDRIAVTVIAPNGIASDGLSTAISVLGRKKGQSLLEQYKGAHCYIRPCSTHVVYVGIGGDQLTIMPDTTFPLIIITLMYKLYFLAYVI